MLFVDAQRQNVAHLHFLVGTRLGQYVFVLFVHTHKRLDFGYDETDDRQVVDSGQRVKSRARCYVNVPGQRVVNGEPVLTERLYLLVNG